MPVYLRRQSIDDWQERRGVGLSRALGCMRRVRMAFKNAHRMAAPGVLPQPLSCSRMVPALSLSPKAIRMTAAPDTRKRELAQIHIAKAQLGLDDDTYRAMLWTVGRVRSAGDLDYAGRRAVLEHLKARGFTTQRPLRKENADLRKKNAAWNWVNNAAPDRQAMLRKLAVMLNADNREKAYVDAIAKHMFGVDLVEFCKPDQLHRIISALTFDANRRAQKATA